MFLDIAIGIFSAIFISSIFQIEPNFWLFFIAILITLLPDADFLFYFPKRGDTKEDHRHRDIIHYPLIYLPVGTIIVWLAFGKVWALLFLIASFLHFIHDSIGIGWGIKWSWPFSRKSYKFFSEKNGKFSKRFIVFWEPKELNEVVMRYGDPDWVKNIYYKWHPIAIIEFLFFVIAVISLIIYVR